MPPPFPKQAIEGVTCQWETLGNASIETGDTLLITRVMGDGSKQVFRCAREESHVIKDFLNSNANTKG